MSHFCLGLLPVVLPMDARLSYEGAVVAAPCPAGASGFTS